MSPVMAIVLPVANLVVVAALPVNSPVNPVDDTEVNPEMVLVDVPKAIAVVPIVIELLANCPLVIPAIPLISVVVIVPSAIFAEVIEPSATPAAAAFKST